MQIDQTSAYTSSLKRVRGIEEDGDDSNTRRGGKRQRNLAGHISPIHN
jgi:hypothetical protein